MMNVVVVVKLKVFLCVHNQHEAIGRTVHIEAM